MSIRLTAAAAERVRSFLRTQKAGVGLRLGVHKTGCSGFAYVVNLAETVTPEDAIFVDRNLKVIVNQRDLPLIRGTVVDFVREGLNETFKFRNPNVKSECGCGESFGV